MDSGAALAAQRRYALHTVPSLLPCLCKCTAVRLLQVNSLLDYTTKPPPPMPRRVRLAVTRCHLNVFISQACAGMQSMSSYRIHISGLRWDAIDECVKGVRGRELLRASHFETMNLFAARGGYSPAGLPATSQRQASTQPALSQHLAACSAGQCVRLYVWVAGCVAADVC